MAFQKHWLWLTPGLEPAKSPFPTNRTLTHSQDLTGTVLSLPPPAFIHFLTKLDSSGGPASRPHLLPSKHRGPLLPEFSVFSLHVSSTQDAVAPSRYSGHTCQENKSTHAITQWRGMNSLCRPSLCADQTPEAADLPLVRADPAKCMSQSPLCHLRPGPFSPGIPTF